MDPLWTPYGPPMEPLWTTMDPYGLDGDGRVSWPEFRVLERFTGERALSAQEWAALCVRCGTRSDRGLDEHGLQVETTLIALTILITLITLVTQTTGHVLEQSGCPASPRVLSGLRSRVQQGLPATKVNTEERNMGLLPEPNLWPVSGPSLAHSWTLLGRSLDPSWTLLGPSLDPPWTLLGPLARSFSLPHSLSYPSMEIYLSAPP